MRQRLRRLLPDLIIAAVLFGVPLLFFLPQTLGGRTLLPVDNLFQYEPYASLAAEYGVGDPHNALISDLILQNLPWKQYAIEQMKSGQLPLWQPDIAAGAPFWGAGQHGMLYPFSVLFLILPLWLAYGWFTVSQLWVAGISMYVLARTLGIRRPGALISALAYQLSAFFIVSVVFPMIISAAAWLPLILAMMELTIRQEKALGGQPATIPWVAIGAIALGMAGLAGHVEALYFTLIVMAYFAAFRVIAGAWAVRKQAGLIGKLVRRSGWLVIMVLLGLMMGAIQLLPAYELASRSFRQGAVTLADVRGWAYPARRLITFLMPNFFGNPAHHQIFDLFSWSMQPVTENAAGDPITNTAWGIKNYVEGGAYLGLLPLALAVLSIGHWISARVHRRPDKPSIDAYDDPHLGAEEKGRPYRLIFAVLGLLSASFVFGAPTYALLYYGLPFINQSHSPFRWVWPLTLCVAVLAGFGVQMLQSFDERMRDRELRMEGPTPMMSITQGLAYVSLGIGALAILAVGGSRLLFTRVEPFIMRLFNGLALADTAFPDAAAFYSYEAGNILVFALFAIVSGLALHFGLQMMTYVPIPKALKDRLPLRGDVPLWLALMPIVIAADLGAATAGFFPANDPDLLNVTPPAIARLQTDTILGRSADFPPADYSPYLWRFMAYEEGGADTMNSNIGWLTGLEDASAYDSLIPAQYADYMRLIEPQDDLQYNRIAPLYAHHPDALDSPLLDVLGVRYVVSEIEIDNPKYELAWQDDAVRIYENLGVLPRAFTLPVSSVVGSAADDPAVGFKNLSEQYDFRQHVVLNTLDWPYDGQVIPPAVAGEAKPAGITVYTANEVWVDLDVSEDSWLLLADSYFPGWKAYIRAFESGDEAETETPIYLVNGNFRGVEVPEGQWTVRFKYTPDSVKLGGFASFMAGMVAIFALGVWLWRYAYRESPQDSVVRRVAKNSLAPIALNLFNRGIQFAFAFIMLRILGPEGSGKYQYAVVIWGWFEIVSNFGLDTFLMREVSRQKDDANRYFVNTSLLRFFFATLGVPLLAGFIWARQNLIAADPLAADTIAAMWLLYIGLFLSTLSKGFTGLFYAYEKAEFPAAVQTVGTILTASLGVVALLLGFGIVGLAGVSIVVNVITLGLISVLAIRLFFRPHLTFSGGMQREAVGESFPLMINHLLATLFFRIDIILLEALRGSVVVGWYGVVYKWIDALNIIPSFFTTALFPEMSRQAQEDRDQLRRSYILSVKLLTLISLPVAVVTTLLATFLIGLLGGPEFLPHGAIALRIFVWSIPIGWINSVTNYVIIALNRQRILTWAFVIGVVFNVALNLIFIPIYSYPAAAVITIASEFVLLVFFYLVMRPATGNIPWLRALWRIAAATVVMGGAVWGLAQVNTLLALVGGGMVYLAAVFVLRPFDEQERAQLAPILPGPVRGRFQPEVSAGQTPA